MTHNNMDFYYKKKLLILLIFILFCGLAYSQISGSKHDFSNRGWSNGEICIPCHTPHNANMTVPDAPLWNHEVTSAVYTLYSSSSMVETPEQPRGPSRLCLSCHDGTIAINRFGTNPGNTPITPAGLIGTDLSDDHPVSIQWTHQNETDTICENCHIVHPWGFNDEVPFYGGYIECPSCHDVHNSTGIDKLLRKTVLNSELCLHCHGK